MKKRTPDSLHTFKRSLDDRSSYSRMNYEDRRSAYSNRRNPRMNSGLPNNSARKNSTDRFIANRRVVEQAVLGRAGSTYGHSVRKSLPAQEHLGISRQSRSRNDQFFRSDTKARQQTSYRKVSANTNAFLSQNNDRNYEKRSSHFGSRLATIIFSILQVFNQKKLQIRRSQMNVLVDDIGSASVRRRLTIILLCIVLVFSLVSWKLASLQFAEAEPYAAQGKLQRTHSEILPADRGTIYDRNGQQLVISQAAKTLFVDFVLLDDIDGFVQQVFSILEKDQTQLLQEITKAKQENPENRFYRIQRNISLENAKKITSLNIRGVGFVDQSYRVKPFGNTGAAILGNVDTEEVGISGIEKKYESRLVGTPGKLFYEKDTKGNPIATGDRETIAPQKGEDLYLTIDSALQYETEQVILRQVRATGASGGIAAIVETRTGNILSMANVVTNKEDGSVEIGTDNAIVTASYEFGSVMKIVPAAGALENDEVTPDTYLDIPYEIEIYDKTFTEHDYHPLESWNVKKIISKSSNVGTIKLAQMLGKIEFFRYLKLFGFGDKTSLDFPNEQTGILADVSKWQGTSVASNAIGQGLSVSPLQVLMAYNAIANDGVYTSPKIAQDDSTNTREIVTSETAHQLNQIFREVVIDGTGTAAAVPGYTVAGKTGTARKPQVGGGYEKQDNTTKYVSTFVGFAPAEQPELSIIVVIDEPTKGGTSGGEVAAPAFSQLMEKALRQQNVSPPTFDVAKNSPVVVTQTPFATQSTDKRVRAVPAGTQIESNVQQTTTTSKANTTSTKSATATKSSPSTTSAKSSSTVKTSTTVKQSTSTTITPTTVKKPSSTYKKKVRPQMILTDYSFSK